MSDEKDKDKDRDKDKDNKDRGKKVYDLPLLPLRDLVVFPHMVIPFFVGRDKGIHALEEAMKGQAKIVLMAQKDAKTDDPGWNDIYHVGTIANIVQLLRMPDGTVKVLAEGKLRVRLCKFVSHDNFILARVEEVSSQPKNPLELQAMMRSIKSVFEVYVRLNKRIPPEILMRVSGIEDPSELADVIFAQLNLRLEDKQKAMSVTSVVTRIEYLLKLINSEVEILEVEKKIRVRVRKQMERSQKEYYLNEQMQAIQKELGEKDDLHAELREMEQKLKQKKMNNEAREKVLKEIKKLRNMSSMSAEFTVIRSYIDWVMALPWGHYSKDRLNIVEAKEILDRDHYGLNMVKERIIEYIAVLSLSKHLKGPILCLVGPPGVGKTSLAHSMASALHKEFARVSLGGLRDEAEIRGHRKTYVGAMPGKIIQSLRRVKTNNPLILLDEIDKMSSDFRGDPASAMLEVLDPEQNCNFQDHYLELDYDLSRAIFVATANSMHNIPRPLIDRMEIMHLEGYTELEKLGIAERYLVPKQINAHGLGSYAVQFNEKVLQEIIRYYTKEAGVRGLEKNIASLLRKVAKDISLKENFKNPLAGSQAKAQAQNQSQSQTQGPTSSSASSTRGNQNKESQQSKGNKTSKESNEKQKGKEKIKFLFKGNNYVLTEKKVQELLGPRQFKFGLVEENNEIGLTQGLAWTDTGGDLLCVEVSVIPGKGKFILTGQLGDVMKESCSAAMSYVRSRGPLLGFDRAFYQGVDVHIHVPEGAVPKDGPSAGVAITTSLVSSITRIPVKKTMAMTGEISLRGKVFAIGGLKEKLLAAHRAGISQVLIPKENEKDLKGLPAEVLKKLKIIMVDHVDQVLVNALDIENPKELFKYRPDEALGVKAKYKGHIFQQKRH